MKKSIREPWNFDLQGKIIGTFMDAFSKYYRVNYDFESDDIMFNSGEMLIDLEQWRRDEGEEKLLKFIASRKDRIQQGDQGALKSVLSHDIYCFDMRFNSITIFYDFTYKEILIYRKSP